MPDHVRDFCSFASSLLQTLDYLLPLARQPSFFGDILQSLPFLIAAARKHNPCSVSWEVQR